MTQDIAELPFGYAPPFRVEVDKDDRVYLVDAAGDHAAVFNTHTQLPLSRQDLLDEERDEWKAWAEFLAASLNDHALTVNNEPPHRPEGHNKQGKRP